MPTVSNFEGSKGLSGIRCHYWVRWTDAGRPSRFQTRVPRRSAVPCLQFHARQKQLEKEREKELEVPCSTSWLDSCEFAALFDMRELGGCPTAAARGTGWTSNCDRGPGKSSRHRRLLCDVWFHLGPIFVLVEAETDRKAADARAEAWQRAVSKFGIAFDP